MRNPPLQKLGKYELRGEIGRGAMGTVYAAWDPVLDRRIAIKTARLSDQADSTAEESVARFRQEARLAGQLTHPGIVGIYDYGETDGLAFIVMEFVEGETLKQVLDQREPIGLDRALDIMSQMLLALSHCHRHGIVHRDLKPSNLLISRDGRVKLTDFGVARTGSSDLTLSGAVIGTPAYMSPEQFTAKRPADVRTDIYASGVICYELLTGRRPFEGDFAAIMQQVLFEQPVPPSHRAPSVPPALDEAVLRALAKTPDERFPSADAFAAALEVTSNAESNDPRQDATVVDARHGAAMGSAAADAPGTEGRTRWPWIAGLGVAGVLAGAALLWVLVGSRSGPKMTAPGPAPAEHATNVPLPVPPVSTPPVSNPSAPPSGPGFVVPLPTPPVAPVPPAVTPSPSPATPPAATNVPQPPAPPPPTTPVQTEAPSPPPPVPSGTDIAAALTTIDCAALRWRLGSSPPQLTVSGVVGAGPPRAALDAAIARLGSAQVRDEVTTFPSSAGFCQAANLVGSAPAPSSSAPRVELEGGGRLTQGQPVRLDLRMADFDGEARIDYLTDGGATVLHPVPLTGPAPRYHARGDVAVDLGTVSPPYGTDMVLVIVTSAPLFTAPRASQESAIPYLGELRTAIDALRDRGGQAFVRALTVETAER